MPKHLMKSSTEEVNSLKTDVSIDLQELPEVIPPPGIPPERQKYLYEQRLFCEPEYTDITCPQPELNSDTDQLAASVEKSNCPPTKRASLCQFANIQASQSLFPCCLLTTWKCVPLVDLLNTLLWAGQNGLPPTPNTLHLGCSYHLHSSHHFLSTWRAIMLKKIMPSTLLSTLSSHFLNIIINRKLLFNPVYCIFICIHSICV